MVTRKPAWVARRSEARRTEIVKALALVLQERGLAGMTMAKIAGRLGMTKGSLYYYFRDKDELLYHCHLRASAASLAALEDGGPALPADARLRRVLAGHIRGITDEVYGAVMLTDLESISQPRRARIVRIRDRFERGVRRILEEGIATGVFAPMDVKLAGFALLGAINWIPKWYDPRGRLSPAAIAEQFSELLVGAVRAPGTAAEPARRSSARPRGRTRRPAHRPRGAGSPGIR
jgi:AcrR family transcriptional regulator